MHFALTEDEIRTELLIETPIFLVKCITEIAQSSVQVAKRKLCL